MQDTLPQAAHSGFGALGVIAGAIECATVHPWIVEACWSRVENCGQRTIKVVLAPLSQHPEAEDHIPAGAIFLRGDVFPASRFEDFNPAARERYRDHYRAFLLWRVARAHGKTVEAVLPQAEASVTERVDRWVGSPARSAA